MFKFYLNFFIDMLHVILHMATPKVYQAQISNHVQSLLVEKNNNCNLIKCVIKICKFIVPCYCLTRNSNQYNSTLRTTHSVYQPGIFYVNNCFGLILI